MNPEVLDAYLSLQNILNNTNLNTEPNLDYVPAIHSFTFYMFPT